MDEKSASEANQDKVSNQKKNDWYFIAIPNLILVGILLVVCLLNYIRIYYKIRNESMFCNMIDILMYLLLYLFIPCLFLDAIFAIIAIIITVLNYLNSIINTSRDNSTESDSTEISSKLTSTEKKSTKNSGCLILIFFIISSLLLLYLLSAWASAIPPMQN